MHEVDTSKIHLLENFIREDECEAILKIADESELNSATVGRGINQARIRKAMQTNIDVPWDKEHEDHPIARVSRRVYDYTNVVLEGLDIQEGGQARPKYLHYSGRGRNDTEPDHYAPHCDFECNGSKHQQSGRVATMVLYW
jgi:hypothetical protein